MTCRWRANDRFDDYQVRERFKTVGDCPNFSAFREENGTVPLSANGFETAS
jgi:hypothetical protein